MNGDLTDELIGADLWTDEQVTAAGIPIVDVPFATIGGGLGSFAIIDTLRIAGVRSADMAVLSPLDAPFSTYKFLANNSQIPDEERLRSDSASTMDNIWGFPGYALREAWADKTLRPLWNVLVEPLAADFYTPRAKQVYESVQREASRIGWNTMVRKGHVRMVRKRHGGGYFSVLTPPSPSTTTRIAIRSRWVHIAVGYPGVKFLPDLQAYRETHRDFSRVVNAYEPHDYVYEELRKRPSTVVVRGSGIVASRILQRLIDDRQQRGAQTQIVHLFRNYVGGPQGDEAWMRRDGGNGFAYQGFNFPKAAWGGQLKERLEALDGPGRAALIGQMGGTNTPHRRHWEQQLELGAGQGFYRQFVGAVEAVEPGPDQTIVTRVRSETGTLELGANFIIDATGLESSIEEHRLLADLLDHGGAGKNDLGRLDVEPTFEIRGTRSEPGRIYASGSITLGGYYAGVDSFLGLQYAALAIADDLAGQAFGARLGATRSLREWWRWARHQPVPDTAPAPLAVGS